MADSILRGKSKTFAKDIVFLCRHLRDNKVDGVLVNQLLKSGTSVGANIHEAQYAQGTKDFISKFEIALKECNESEYWLELLCDTDSISREEFEDYQKQCVDLRKMLVSSVTTLKNKQNQMAEHEGITEQFKAENQMEWVARMNNIRSRATETVNTDLIYT